MTLFHTCCETLHRSAGGNEGEWEEDSSGGVDRPLCPPTVERDRCACLLTWLCFHFFRNFCLSSVLRLTCVVCQSWRQSVIIICFSVCRMPHTVWCSHTVRLYTYRGCQWHQHSNNAVTVSFSYNVKAIQRQYCDGSKDYCESTVVLSTSSVINSIAVSGVSSHFGPRCKKTICASSLSAFPYLHTVPASPSRSAWTLRGVDPLLKTGKQSLEPAENVPRITSPTD